MSGESLSAVWRCCEAAVAVGLTALVLSWLCVAVRDAWRGK